MTELASNLLSPNLGYVRHVHDGSNCRQKANKQVEHSDRKGRYAFLEVQWAKVALAAIALIQILQLRHTQCVQDVGDADLATPMPLLHNLTSRCRILVAYVHCFFSGLLCT